MIDWMRCGELPPKPHTAFRSASGALRYEECLTRRGFDGEFSILYHEGPPMTDLRIGPATPGPFDRRAGTPAPPQPLERRLVLGEKAPDGFTPILDERRRRRLALSGCRGKPRARTGFRTATGTTFFISMKVRERWSRHSATYQFAAAITWPFREESSIASGSLHLSKEFSSNFAAASTSRRNSGIRSANSGWMRLTRTATSSGPSSRARGRDRSASS